MALAESCYRPNPVDQLNFPSVWLQQRLEKAIEALPSGKSLLVSAPPCAFGTDIGVRTNGIKLACIADQTAWLDLCEVQNPLDEPTCIVAPYPWWTSEVRHDPEGVRSWWVECEQTFFSRCTDSELSMLLETDAVVDASGTTSVSELRWASGGWPGLASAWLAGRFSEREKSPDTGDVAGFKAMQACFEGSWLPIASNQAPALKTVPRLPWLDRNLVTEVFSLVPGQLQALQDQEWLLISPDRPEGLEVDPALQRLLVASVKPVPSDLEKARVWYAAGAHLSEAIHCAVALGIPISELAARALMGTADRSAGDHQRAGFPRPQTGTSSRSWEDELASALRRAYEIMELQRKPISSEIINTLASALYRHTVPGREPFFLRSLNSFASAARAPRANRQGSALRNISLNEQGRAAALALQQDPLNHRESQILRKICTGLRNRDISNQLGLELSTVKWYATRIYAKLGVKNRTQAVVRAQELGLSE